VRTWLISAQLLALALGLLSPSFASAQAGRRLASPLDREAAPASEPSSTSLMPQGWALDVAALTSVPLSIGAEIQLQTPVGVFANLSGGHTPNAYLSMMADIVQGAGAFDSDLRPAIDEVIGSGAWNVRVAIGINPIEGLELSFGYTYMTLSSELTRSAIETATGQRVRYRGMREVPIDVELHALHGRIGYRFVIEEHFVLRASLGWTHSVAGSGRVTVPEEIRELEDNPADQIESAVAEGIGSYGFSPELVLSAGYRF